MKHVPRGAGAVMAQRIEPPDSLDFFPTPPWATRALCEHVLFDESGGERSYGPALGDWCIRPSLPSLTCWEPAAGEGHMAEPLREYFREVLATDIHDYGRGYPVGDFLGDGFTRMKVRIGGVPPDWIITNPPFRLASEFVRRAIKDARVGVALFMRTVFLESAERYSLFQDHPLAVFAPFAERVCLTKGRWEPKGSTATSYAWFVWFRSAPRGLPRVQIIPPGRRAALTKPEDMRFAAEAA